MNCKEPDPVKAEAFDEYGNAYPWNDDLLSHYHSHQWRIRNMYAIKPDKTGPALKFMPRPVQDKFYSNSKRRNLVVKSRGDGISTATAVKLFDLTQYHRNFNVSVVGLTEDQSEKLYADMYLFMWENFPKCYLSLRQPLKPGHLPNGSELVFANDSEIHVVVEARGGTNQGLHCTELGKVAERDPEKARRFKTGALPTLRTDDAILIIESTGHGPDNLFHQMALESRNITERIAKGEQPYNQFDRVLHFFPWFDDPMRARTTPYPVSKEVEAYLSEIESKSKVKLTDQQRWWYAWELATEQFTTEDMQMEYPSTFEECFERSTEGRIYLEEMRAMRKSDPPRIGEFTYDPRYPVHTCWDCGRDGTAIWFFQMQGNWITMIWYYEYAAMDILHGIDYLKSHVPWPTSAYGVHAGPHDIGDKTWLNMEENAIVVAARLGVDFIETQRPHRKENGWQAVRMIFPRLRISEKNCAIGIKRLDGYKMKNGHEVHDECSHCADAMQTLGMYVQQFSGRRGPRSTKKAGMPSDFHPSYMR